MAASRKIVEVTVGTTIGVSVGVIVKVTVGIAVGETVGVMVGVVVGATVGVAAGVTVGVSVGVTFGTTVGVIVGFYNKSAWLPDGGELLNPGYIRGALRHEPVPGPTPCVAVQRLQPSVCEVSEALATARRQPRRRRGLGGMQRNLLNLKKRLRGDSRYAVVGLFL